MRVVVTGGAGFLGSHLVDLLVERQHEVTVVDNLSTGRSGNLRHDVPFVRYDVRNPLIELFATLRPEVVIHLAAQVSVPRSVTRPLDDMAINIGGTVNVMEAAGKCGARKVIAVSSAAVYGVPHTLPVHEDSQLSALSPYGLSKLTGESYVKLLGDMFQLEYTILRPSNLYGPRQLTEGEGAVIPAFLQSFLAARNPVIHGTGNQVRDFLFVGDAARAIEQALTRGNHRTLNISRGMGTTINELWRQLAAMSGWSHEPVYGPVRPGDIPNSVLSNAASQQQLHWAPEVTLPEGLGLTVAWALEQRAAAGAQ